MRKAFTLVELLVVIGIMGFLGTISVGGYRAMQRGMEERGVMQNVDSLVKAAYERAQIDRQPTAIYFWNETLREENENYGETIVVVGRAVAVRRQGRLSRVSGGVLFDEFADLDRTYPKADTAAEGGDGTGDAGENTMYLYNLDKIESEDPKRSIVSQRVVLEEPMETYMGGLPSDSTGSGKIEMWGFEVEDANNVEWKAGSAYGIEFAEITLPHNYIFGSQYKERVSNPVQEAGTMVFKVGRNSGNGVQGGASTVKGSITVYSLRPDQSGRLSAQKVDTNKSPY